MLMHLTLVPFIRPPARSRPSRPSIRSRNCARSASSRTSCCAAASTRCRTAERRKIALFTNVPEQAVISATDVDIIYKLPLWLHAQGLDDIVVKRLGLDAGPADLSSWQRTVDAMEHPKDEVTVAIVGKYVEHKDAYKSLGEALRHGGIKQQARVNLSWVDSETG